MTRDVRVVRGGGSGPRVDGRSVEDRSVDGRLVVDGREVADVELALTRRARRTGLLGRDAMIGALMISPCSSVHTVRMRFAIDVAHLDRMGRVLSVVTMRPGRVGRRVRGARSVIEGTAGSFAVWGLAVGSTVTVRSTQPLSPDATGPRTPAGP